MTKVAVVILNWNGEKLLQEFLPIVIEHSKLEGVEVVVADNASTDHSVQVIENKFPSVKVIRMDNNYGFAGGYNRALQQVESEYVVLLNSDVAPGINWLPPLIQEMETHPQTAICVPKIKSYRQPTYFEYAGAAGGYIDPCGFTFCKGRIFDVIEEDKGQYNQSASVFWASGAAMMIRSKLYTETGGLDEDFFAHMEEIDLCWRLKNRGWDIRYIANSEVFHLGGATLDYTNPQKVYLNFRNNLFLLIKNLPKNKWFFKLFLRMILDGLAAVKFLLSGKIYSCWSVLKAHFSFYASFLSVYKKRMHNLKYVICNKHPEMYSHSVIVQFFIKKKSSYSELDGML
ncbi:glycosyltransferase family 2 protein [Saccharicrinis fermentans]|uniref:dTDP-Rha:alpha-D-GlcNAc-pyrophosphate polyprenol, alpha-3-L-rhamnosyltransferase n=1 Tax=Saccharicrinis fermentans DSM 9555 = JCM 21142 TaxID=869213 RepID=W7YDR7_9BACT|nr:glycosyltransferase family 2 protein [Saccharicrinis fermentans]GAF05628.1 dTDP-Rha:alpha-D-GlcNAc-pyrophosphate polyprenol, alpha-3-L-rhamnosyltransferase [Saccharicrinis fermentans DSM 9555 = JCM 21142]